ncbi:MAG: MBL fold metallo-hydrolase [Arenicella sp.]|nr:MBL fold metallo-hydrolase [Arenicella sp.]
MTSHSHFDHLGGNYAFKRVYGVHQGTPKRHFK